MHITNTIITVNDREFTFKDEIKAYLYSFIEKHPFRVYNNRIAEKHGHELFSMTFVKPNKAVLTQRYPLKQEYLASLVLREDCFSFFPENITVEISEVFEYTGGD